MGKRRVLYPHSPLAQHGSVFRYFHCHGERHQLHAPGPVGFVDRVVSTRDRPHVHSDRSFPFLCKGLGHPACTGYGCNVCNPTPGSASHRCLHYRFGHIRSVPLLADDCALPRNPDLGKCRRLGGEHCGHEQRGRILVADHLVDGSRHPRGFGDSISRHPYRKGPCGAPKDRGPSGDDPEGGAPRPRA